MPTVTMEYSTEEERIVLEQAVAYFSHMRQLAANAPAGTVLEACEQLALSDGRQLLRDSLVSAVQSRVQSVDAKKKSPVRNRKDGTSAGS